ncbi:MAG: acetylornithine deacetylase [Alphaproteobacteria bacterium]|nr:acetylornithine deacetylase [Alphaproteobacteria bacterium]
MSNSKSHNTESYNTEKALQDALNILRHLVGFNTVSSNGNSDLIAYVQDFLNTQNEANHTANIIQHQLIYAPPDKADERDKDKVNLWAMITPPSNNVAGIALSGHTDVVPVTGQDWQTDPFTLHVTQDKAYGRGTCDMKGFLACALAMVPYFASLPLKKPLMLYFSYDEEVGCRGVQHLIDQLGKELPAPEAIIVGEPSNLKTLSAHKSMVACETFITGRAGHSSNLQKGVSATMIAARLVNFIHQMLAENQQQALKADNNIASFDPPYSGLHVGVIEGGIAFNIIAEKARFLWDIRTITNDDPNRYIERLQQFADEVLLPEMRAIAPESDIVTHQNHALPNFNYQPDSAAEHLVRRLSGDNSVSFASYMAETGLFQKAGFPSIIYGPGDIAQAHQPNEWVHLDQLRGCLDFLYRLGQDMSR